MSDLRRDNDDYEDEEEEGQVEENNSSQDDEVLNEAERWKSVGNKHMASMEYNKAYNAYSTALKISPLGPYSHVYLSNRAAALLSLKRYSAAIIDSRRAIALAPTFGKGHARLGQSLYFLKDYAGAIEAYQIALQYEPDNQVTMIYLTKAKRKLERAEEKAKRRESVDNSDLVSVAESTVIFSPESPQRDHSASILTGRRNTNLAETLYPAIDHKYPTYPEILTPGDIETVDDIKPWVRPSTSSTVSKSSMDDAPYDESSSMKKPKIQWAQDQGVEDHDVKDDEEDDDDDDDGPDPDFDQALKLQDRASAQLTKKQYKSAVDLYSAALFLVPDDFNLTPHLFVGRANALNGLLRHEGAYNDCKMALNHNPKLAVAHSTMARSLFYLKDYRGAIESFDMAISCLSYGEFLSPLDELYYEKAVELCKDQPNDKVDEDDAVSAVSSSYHSIRSMGTSKPIPKLNPPRFVSRVEALNTSPTVPALPKQWAEKIPHALSSLSIGPERNVVFITERLGVKLNRGPDGIVRVLNVSDQTSGDSPIVRKGDIAVGDIVREAVGVDLRRPITRVMWADTVALMKMADRPITLTVAIELSNPPPTVIEEINRHAKQRNNRIGSISLPKLKKTIVRGQQQYDHNHYDPMNPSYANGTEPVRKKTSKNNSSGDDVVDVDQALAQATAVFADVFKSNDHFALLDEESEVILNAKNSPAFEISEPVTEQEGGIDRDASKDNHDSENSNFTEASVKEDTSAASVVAENSSRRGNEKFVKKDRKIPNINLSKWNPLAQAGAVLNPIAQATSVFVDVLNPNDKASERSYSKVSDDHEIIFPRSLSSQGWDQDAWNATEWSRRLIHGGTVRRWVKGNDLWSEDPTAVYSMALYSEPNIIVLMRFPKNAAEVRTLLNLPSDGEQLGKTADTFLIAEEVIDLKTCKLKLSKVTTPTSLCEDNRRAQFFDLITPAETFSITARYSNSASQGDILIATSEWEQKISEALFSTHEQERSTPPLLGWKHHLVIGSLHSYIAHKKNTFLQQALSSAKDTSIVDGIDDDGLTPLLFACLRRNSDAVSILLSAGADRFQVTPVGRKTLFHVSAELLDDRTLSVLLSSARGKPNALDDLGRTPMYLAIVDGKNVDGSYDIQLLKSCLNVLENSGGLIYFESNGSSLPHPIPYLSSKWKGAVLSVVLSHCNYRYSKKVTFDGSLSSFYGYPLHVCFVSLRDKIIGMSKSERKRERSPAAEDEDLMATLQVLLDHGFEPNERIEYLQKDGVFAEELRDMAGFAPIQILAAASLDLKDSARIGTIKQSVQSSIEDLIATAAEVLIRNGARITLEAPPKARPQRFTPSSTDAISIVSTQNQLSKVERSMFKLDKYKELLESFGADEDLKDDVIHWIEAKVVMATDRIEILEKDKDLSSFADSKGPGGSDVNSCAICWKAFKKGLIGSGSKKKTVCILSKRVLCEDCCGKSLEKDGAVYKISDGQFNMARKDITRQEDEEREAENERIRQQNLRVEMAKRASEREKQDDLFGGAFDTVKGFINSNVKEIKDLAEKIKVEGVDSDAEEEYEGLGTTLAGTRDAFNERGERLNVLRDKSAALKDGGQEYLRLAKELRLQQESRGGGFFSR